MAITKTTERIEVVELECALPDIVLKEDGTK